MNRNCRQRFVDDLPDCIILKIIYLLPCDSVIRCKSVCKRWLSLISNPSFPCRYLSVRLIDNQLQHPVESRPSSFLFFNRSKNSEPQFFTKLKNTYSFKNPKFTLDVIPYYQNFIAKAKSKGKEAVKFPILISTHNDLVLFFESKFSMLVYFLCNVYTKQLFTLPPAPQRHKSRRAVRFGFICEPYYYIKNEEKQRSTTQRCLVFNSGYRYRVVRVIEPNRNFSFRFKVDIFLSETGQWREFTVTSPRKFILDDYHMKIRAQVKVASIKNCVACNGMLYFKVSEGVVGFDPFNNCINDKGCVIDKCCFIGKPVLEELDDPQDIEVRSEYNWSCSFLTCCGEYLRVVVPIKGKSITVWELKIDDQDNIGKGAVLRWSLVAKVTDIWRGQRAFSVYRANIVGFDPNDKYVLLIEWHKYLISCDILQRGIYIRRRSVDVDEQNRWANYLPVVPVPLWPTPISSLPSPS